MGSEEPLVRIRGLRRSHTRRGRRVEALAGADLDIPRGAAVALVGRSGAGKSTLARCLARLEDATAGEIVFDGTDVRSLRGPGLRAFRRQVQLILQDSAAALDPRMSALECVAEPLEITGIDRPERTRRARELLEAVRLPPDLAGRRPAQMSGGQRQRLAIARALAMEPRLLILDEAFAGLDAPVRAQIATLLADLRAQRDLTFLYVSHDLAAMAASCDTAAVIHDGRIVEQGPIARLFAAPGHPETRALVDSIALLPVLPA
jgi:ABC-type glutathione transport system ATPase component